MRRSIILSLLLVLVTLGTATIARPDSGRAQTSPEASPFDGVTIRVIGATTDQNEETLALIDVSIEPEFTLPITPDEPRESVFQVIEGTLSISINEGSVTLNHDGDESILASGGGEVELVKGDVISAVNADYSLTNKGAGAAMARDADAAIAQSSGSAKLLGAVRGCRSFCPGK
jgi:quercetin dioxygenase-like cupin family protein